MKIFKLLTIILIFIYPMYADEYIEQDENKEIESNWNYFGEFKTYFTKIHKVKEKVGIENYNELMNYNSLQLSIDYYDDGFYFSVTPYAYIYFTESDDKIVNTNFSTPFKSKDFFFRTLYISYTIDKFTIGAGVLPLSNSFPMQYTNDYYQDGEGLNILADRDPLALFIKYKFSDTNQLLAGIGVINIEYIPVGTYVNEHNVDDSYGTFLTQTITNDKFKIINDFKFSNISYDGVELGKIYSIGTGISWDDSEYSGWTFYNTLAFSLYENNSIAVKDKILANNPKLTPTAMNLFPNSFTFDNKTYTGAANLFGFRKDLDLFNIESFINFEWFHIFGDWASGNKGAPYNSNSNQMSNIRNNSYFINYGIRINELTTFKINYTYLEFDEIINIGAPSSTPVNEAFGPQRSSLDIVKVSFSYKF
ncbi:MAG: hypothetical protein U9N02_00055 [Campylobacterota bacterium]|nr:hypothetical protein [Campylobacterota bacterium]